MVDNKIKVFDNYLSPKDFTDINLYCLGRDIKWTLCSEIVQNSESEYNFQFVDTVYHVNKGITSPTSFNVIKPFIEFF